MEKLRLRDRERTLDHTLIVGVLNVTPDSFADGGKFIDVDLAVEHAKQMVADGADIIDVGGESTRPGAAPVSAEEELSRVMPVLTRLLKEVDQPISVDTYKPEVAGEVLKAGAHMINDISGLSEEGMAKVVAEFGAALVIMHMQGEPKTMQEEPKYQDVVEDIKQWLSERVKKARDAGIEDVIVDPGIGFGKTLEHNLDIIRKLDEFKALGCPIMVGPSRKSFIEKISGLSVEERLEGSIAAAVISVINGADIVRVHDVRETYRALQVVDAVRQDKASPTI